MLWDVSGVVVCCRCHWESRPQQGGGIAQAWATWPEGALAPNGTMKCRGHGVPEMVTPAMRTTAVLLGFLNLTKNAMFSFAMTSGLASDSDKFKIIITLRRAQKFGDTGPYKNFIFLNNPLTDKFFWKFELNAMGRLWRCCLLSVPLGEQASARRWDCSGLGHVARRCFGTKWYDEVPGARSTRDGDTGNEDNSSFARFFKLDKKCHVQFCHDKRLGK